MEPQWNGSEFWQFKNCRMLHLHLKAQNSISKFNSMDCGVLDTFRRGPLEFQLFWASQWVAPNSNFILDLRFNSTTLSGQVATKTSCTDGNTRNLLLWTTKYQLFATLPVCDRENGIWLKIHYPVCAHYKKINKRYGCWIPKEIQSGPKLSIWKYTPHGTVSINLRVILKLNSSA